MKNDIRNEIKRRRLFFDGGTGTVLQSMGLPAGMPPERWDLDEPGKVTALHKSYIDAGADIIKTNTFGVNRMKYADFDEYIGRAIDCAADAVGDRDVYIAFDIGPTGHLLEPLGDLSFEDAVSVFADSVRAAVSHGGVDLILIETMNDSYETKAAVLAAKENSDLPVFVTNVYDADGKLMTGADPEAMVALLEGLRVDALGMNCSLGPDKMLPLVKRFADASSTPIIVNPNAGLPSSVDGKTVFSTGADEFAGYMREMALCGACILGGCCGTDPGYIKKTVEAVSDVPYVLPEEKAHTVVSSYTHAVRIGASPVLIGERINPTGKSKLKDALRSGDLGYILSEAINQTEAGAHILDVNVGLPKIDETEMMTKVIRKVQEVTDAPLQIDSSSPAVLEKAMRIYNGKPLVNSVNGTEESMAAVFPLVAKYGGTVIALTMDEGGIPKTASERAEIAKRIVSRAALYGIAKKDIIADPLALTVSSDQTSALTTLGAIKLIREMGIRTSLGVSNISFGLPHREKINSSFFNSALEVGLDCAIMNPFDRRMTDVYYSYRVLHGMDKSCAEYIAYAADEESAPAVTSSADGVTLVHAIMRGMKEKSASLAQAMLADMAPLDVINGHIIPALNGIGKDFEEKRAYLPQLLMSAEAAQASFDVIKSRLPKDSGISKGEVILATVRGDIHDIGKNIVRVMLESYGFTVHDLGRDVAPERIVGTVRETGCRLVGLSALMTTTVPAMEAAIRMLHEEAGDVTVIVGGAVLTAEYAEMIGADFYAGDAMETVRLAEKYYG